MRLNYDKHVDGDHVTIRTPSVLRFLWGAFRFAVAITFALTALGALIGGDWGTAGWCVALAVLFVPKAKRRKAP